MYATDLAPASTTFSPSVLRPMAGLDARAVHHSGVLRQCGDNCRRRRISTLMRFRWASRRPMPSQIERGGWAFAPRMPASRRPGGRRARASSRRRSRWSPPSRRSRCSCPRHPQLCARRLTRRTGRPVDRALGWADPDPPSSTAASTRRTWCGTTTAWTRSSAPPPGHARGRRRSQRTRNDDGTSAPSHSHPTSGSNRSERCTCRCR